MWGGPCGPPLIFRSVMPTYRFKNDCKVYLTDGSLKYKIEVYPDLTFSQTFEEKAQSVKTLHDQDALFETAIINKANPADFQFTVILGRGNDFTVLGNWLTAVTTYDLYVDNGADIFKITKATITGATFNIVKDQLLTVSLQGTASWLSRFGATGTAIPGTSQTRDIDLQSIILTRMDVQIGGISQESISSVNVDLSNEVRWLEYDDLHKSLYVTSTSETQVPEVFVVSKKVLSGTIQQYVTESTLTGLQGWSLNTPIRIRVGDSSGYYLDINIPNAVITDRVQPDTVFMQTYDFRMTSSPLDLSTIINYNL